MEGVTRLQSRLQSLLDRTSRISDDVNLLTDHQDQIEETLVRLEDEIDNVEAVAMSTETAQALEQLRTSMKNAVNATINEIHLRINLMEEANVSPISPPQIDRWSPLGQIIITNYVLTYFSIIVSKMCVKFSKVNWNSDCKL